VVTKKTSPEEPEKGPNEVAIEKTLEAMGQPAPADAARFQMLRSLARAVDSAPFKAALWTEYREALSDLKTDLQDGDKGLEEAVAALKEAARGAPSVGNAKDRKADARR